MVKLTLPDRWLEEDLPGWEAEKKTAADLLERVRAGEPKYHGSLGWLHTQSWAGDDALERLSALGAEIRSKAGILVLIGVGGSNNAARSVLQALKPQGMEVLYAGNSLSPHALNELLERIEGRQVFLNCIAKNFETLEPGVAFRVLRLWMERRYGAQESARRILCTGTPGSSLEELCTRRGYAFLPFPTDIGGRYSALSNVGLLPMAAAGVDITRLVKGARGMDALLWEAPPEENPALLYAAFRDYLSRRGYRVELLSSFEPRLRWFYKWWEQLFAESEGKDGKGIFPVTGEFSEELHSLGQFIQDGFPMLFETFLTVAEPGAGDRLILPADRDTGDGFDYLEGMDLWQVNRTAFSATLQAHGERLPCAVLELPRLEEESLGALFYFFQFACYLSCRLTGVDPFDQPGVEAYKQRMFQGLGRP